MDTFEQAIESLRHVDAPYWWLTSGNHKVGQNLDEQDVNASVELLRKSVGFLPNGSYKLECSKNSKDRTGSFKFSFNKAQGSAQTNSTTMSAINSSNAYGIDDKVHAKIVEEARRTLMFEQMHSQFPGLVKDVEDLKKEVERLSKILADDDEDGEIDILQSAKKVSEVVSAGKQLKGLFAA